MIKKNPWLPLGVPLFLYFILCCFITFTEIGSLLIIILLPLLLFMVILIPIIFYIAGKYTEKRKAHGRIPRFTIALVSGVIFAVMPPFLMDLDQFIRWGNWKTFLVALSLENLLFYAVPFCLVFIPCWVGQEVQHRSGESSYTQDTEAEE